MLSFLKRLLGLEAHPACKNVSANAFAATLQATPDAVLIDVRTQHEFQSGHLPKALNMDISMGVFKRKLADLDKNKVYFLYCRSGNRSSVAANMMANAGFTQIYNMVGGIGQWKGKIVK